MGDYFHTVVEVAGFPASLIQREERTVSVGGRGVSHSYVDSALAPEGFFIERDQAEQRRYGVETEKWEQLLASIESLAFEEVSFEPTDLEPGDVEPTGLLTLSGEMNYGFAALDDTAIWQGLQELGLAYFAHEAPYGSEYSPRFRAYNETEWGEDGREGTVDSEGSVILTAGEWQEHLRAAEGAGHGLAEVAKGIGCHFRTRVVALGQGTC